MNERQYYCFFRCPPTSWSVATFKPLSYYTGVASTHRILPSLLTSTWPASLSRLLQIIRWVYSIGFLAGTYTHLKSILAHGFLATPVPFAIGVYWDTLTLLDPLTVILLWRRPKVGLWLAVAIMGSDISVNTLVYLKGYFGPPSAHLVPLSLFEQSLFGLFVFLTAPLAYSNFIKQE
jgi:hypothetical protein